MLPASEMALNHVALSDVRSVLEVGSVEGVKSQRSAFVFLFIHGRSGGGRVVSVTARRERQSLFSAIILYRLICRALLSLAA